MTAAWISVPWRGSRPGLGCLPAEYHLSSPVPSNPLLLWLGWIGVGPAQLLLNAVKLVKERSLSHVPKKHLSTMCQMLIPTAVLLLYVHQWVKRGTEFHLTLHLHHWLLFISCRLDVGALQTYKDIWTLPLGEKNCYSRGKSKPWNSVYMCVCFERERKKDYI